MTDSSAPDSPEALPDEQSAHSDTPLEEVVDDLTPKEECADWIHEQMIAGRAIADVAAELISSGWDEEEAESLVEHVRRATRHERGVTTRDDVLLRVNQSYRQSWRMTWFSGFLALASGVRLIGAIRNWVSLRRSRKAQQKSNPPE